MNNAGFCQVRIPPQGDGAQRLGGNMNNAGFAKCEFPLGGTARSALGTI